MTAGTADADTLPLASKSRLGGVLMTSAPLVSNGFSAIANTAAVFALSTSAGEQFPKFAASTAALILAYGTARSVLGEPIMLTQRDRQTGGAGVFPAVVGWASASLIVGTVFGFMAAVGLEVAGIQGVAWVTLAAVSALIFNDAARHLCFSRGSAWTAATGDVALALVTLSLWALASKLDPYRVYVTWLVAAAIAGVAMSLVTTSQIRTNKNAVLTPDIPAVEWIKAGWPRTRWLAAEAIAVTAAVTLPLILAAEEVAGPGRLLLSWFGFQQILFFAAYAVATRGSMNAVRTAMLLFSAGALGALVVGLGITFAPEDALIRLFGPSAQEAQRWALWFGGAQILTAAGNATALAARLISGAQVETATKLFRTRLLFAIVSTIGGVAGALTFGISGYIAGSALGAMFHVVVSAWILRPRSISR